MELEVKKYLSFYLRLMIDNTNGKLKLGQFALQGVIK